MEDNAFPQDLWAKEHGNGSVIVHDNWMLVAQMASKVYIQFMDRFHVEFKTPKPGKGRSLELLVVPIKSCSYEKAVASLQEVKAYCKGIQSMVNA